MQSRYAIELVEWETRDLDITLSDADRAFIAKLPIGRVRIEEMRRYVRVTTRSWIGVMRLSSVELRILPKMAGGRHGLVRLLDAAGGIPSLKRLQTQAGLLADDQNLLDLIALLLAEACEEVAKRGLLAGYLEHRDDLRVVRGRIDYRRQVLHHFGRVDTLACEFDELEHDILDNWILAAALSQASRYVTSGPIHRRISRQWALFDSVTSTHVFDISAAKRQLTYDRLNAHYEPAHQLAWLLLDGLGVEDLLSGGETTSFAFLLNMSRLFELFVERLLTQSLGMGGIHILLQRRHRSVIWDETAGRPYATVVPDILVKSQRPPNWCVPVDAKYKDYGRRSVSNDDLYQTFLYAYTLGEAADLRPRRAVLLYPAAADEVEETTLQVRPRRGAVSANIIVLGIPIPRALDELQRRTLPQTVLHKLRSAVRTEP